MFSRSAARDTLQGQAIQSVNEKWGDDFLQRSGRETIGITVCKKKYNPFLFHVVAVKQPTSADLETKSSGSITVAQVNRVEVLVERMYGCKCHHGKRKEVILEHGVRKGWQSYGAWSLKKALNRAKKEEIKLNQQISDLGDLTIDVDSDEETENLDGYSSAGASSGIDSGDISRMKSFKEPENLNIIRSIHLPGDYTWKLRSAYDNIFKEIHGYTESDADDLRDEFAKRIVAKKVEYSCGDDADIPPSKVTDDSIAKSEQSAFSLKSRSKPGKLKSVPA